MQTSSAFAVAKIEDVEDPQVGALSERLAAREGLSIKAAHMDIYGFCRACQASAGNERAESEEANES